MEYDFYKREHYLGCSIVQVKTQLSQAVKIESSTLIPWFDYFGSVNKVHNIECWSSHFVSFFLTKVVLSSNKQQRNVQQISKVNL